MRKKIISIAVLFIFYFQILNAQIDLTGNFNSTDIGRNVNININKHFNKHLILFGLKYQIGNIIQNNQSELFRKTFYPLNFKEAMGFDVGYQYYLNIDKIKIDPFLFYDFQFTNSHTRNDIIIPVAYDNNGNVLYNRFLEFFGPTVALEHNFGIGVKIKIYKQIFLYQRIGWGIVTFHNVDKQIWGHDEFFWEFGHIFSVGILYNLNFKKKSDN